MRTAIPKLLFIFFIAFLFHDTIRAQTSDIKKIKTETVWQYNILAGENGADGLKISFKLFNEKGLPLEITTYKSDGSPSSHTTFSYDERSFLVESAMSSDDKLLNQRTIFIYQDSMMSESMVYNPDGSLKIRSQYKYDYHRNLIELINYDANDVIQVKALNVFDDLGHLLETVTYGVAGKLLSKSAFLYEKNFSVMNILDKDGNVLQKTEKEYSVDGSVSKEIFYRPDGKITTIMSYTRNNMGLPIEEIIETPGVNLRTRTIKTYDEKGNLLEQIFYNKIDQPVKRIKSYFEYYD